MKPAHAPDVPGNTPWARFDNAVKQAFSVSREELDKRTKTAKRAKTRKRGRRST